MSYNIAIGRHASLETLAEVIAAGDPDLLGVQELDRFTQRSGPEVDQVAVLAELTGMQAHFVQTTPWDGGIFGHALFLKPGLALVESMRVELPVTPPAEPRALLWAGIDVDADDEADLWVVHTHLTSETAADREAQAEVLVDYAAPGPALLLGDLNTGGDAPAFRTLETVWRDALDDPNSIDHVMHDLASDWQVLEARSLDADDHPEASSASDHRPQLVVFGPP